MQFGFPLPLWLIAVVAAVIGGLAFLSYRRSLVSLTTTQRGTLMALRALALGAVVLFLCRPTILEPPVSDRQAVVPILIDVSRSMRIADAGGRTRIADAARVLQATLWPEISRRFTPELYTFGDSVTPAALEGLGVPAADAQRTDLAGAITAIRERYRGRRVPGIVVLSDGGDTAARAPDAAAPPVFAVGIGSPDGVADREVLGISAGDPRLDRSSVDLRVTAVSHLFGREPFDLRLLVNRQAIEVRRIVPSADGSPIDEVFTVSPDPVNGTVYSAEITTAPDEAIAENNSRSVLVSPAGRKRRILVIEGAPGFEHSFMTRAFARDSILEFDSVVRKGRNEAGEATFFVQSDGGRAAALTSGFPDCREALYAYDALVLANIEGSTLTEPQLAMIADFVAERGGGLLVMGGRSFAERGLIGTRLEDALPVELDGRRAGLVRTSFGAAVAGANNTVALTPEGENHPVMRIGASPDENRKLWAALPALAGTAPLGGPKPGATVLAVTAVPGGSIHPVVAVQRYGRGRTMVFAGEGAWRWRMMQPASDHSYEYFWRQAARWLGGPAPDPVVVTVPSSPEPGDTIQIGVEVRDAAFAPSPDASVSATLTVPGGTSRSLTLRHEAGAVGRFTAAVFPEQPGLYRLHAEARRGAQGSTLLGRVDRWFYVGGADREFAEPRLNEGFLRRLTRDSGGRYVRAEEASRLLPALAASVPPNTAPERRDLWHEPWAFAVVIALLSAEWILRRRWGLR